VAADAVIYFEADANWLSFLFRMVEMSVGALKGAISERF